MSGSPKDIFLSESSTVLTPFGGSYDGNSDTGRNALYMPYSEYFSNEITYYVWASHNTVGTGRIEIKGFCATKYK